MLIKTPLGFDDFTDDDLAVNADGDLTPGQYERLLAAARRESRLKIGFGVQIIGSLALLVMWYTFVGLSQQPGSPSLETLRSISIVVVVIIWIFPLVRWLRSDGLKRVRRLEVRDFLMESYDGPANLELYPEDRSQDAHEKHHIRIDDYSFPVTVALWMALRPDQNNVRLHYMVDPFVALVSAMCIPRVQSPTDEELAHVIGIGDDGELIYEEQDAPRGARRAQGKE